MSVARENYDSHYQSACTHMHAIVGHMVDHPGRVVSITLDAGGKEALQALFDAAMDNGHRQALVKLVDASTLPAWAREQLEVFLYGGRRKNPPALFSALH